MSLTEGNSPYGIGVLDRATVVPTAPDGCFDRHGRAIATRWQTSMQVNRVVSGREKLSRVEEIA
jgi:hypothetical protein